MTLTIKQVNTMESGPELNALIMQHIIGKQIVGWTTCYNCEGTDCVNSQTKPEDWMCPAWHGPVYQKEQDQWRDDDVQRFNGISDHALCPVPDYSQDNATALGLMDFCTDKLGWYFTLEQMVCGGYGIQIWDEQMAMDTDAPFGNNWIPLSKMFDGKPNPQLVANTLPLGICRAALIAKITKDLRQ